MREKVKSALRRRLTKASTSHTLEGSSVQDTRTPPRKQANMSETNGTDGMSDALSPTSVLETHRVHSLFTTDTENSKLIDSGDGYTCSAANDRGILQQPKWFESPPSSAKHLGTTSSSNSNDKGKRGKRFPLLKAVSPRQLFMRYSSEYKPEPEFETEDCDPVPSIALTNSEDNTISTKDEFKEAASATFNPGWVKLGYQHCPSEITQSAPPRDVHLEQPDHRDKVDQPPAYCPGIQDPYNYPDDYGCAPYPNGLDACTFCNVVSFVGETFTNIVGDDEKEHVQQKQTKESSPFQLFPDCTSPCGNIYDTLEDDPFLLPVAVIETRTRRKTIHKSRSTISNNSRKSRKRVTAVINNRASTRNGPSKHIQQLRNEMSFQDQLLSPPPIIVTEVPRMGGWIQCVRSMDGSEDFWDDDSLSNRSDDSLSLEHNDGHENSYDMGTSRFAVSPLHHCTDFLGEQNDEIFYNTTNPKRAPRRSRTTPPGRMNSQPPRGATRHSDEIVEELFYDSDPGDLLGRQSSRPPRRGEIMRASTPLDGEDERGVHLLGSSESLGSDNSIDIMLDFKDDHSVRRLVEEARNRKMDVLWHPSTSPTDIQRLDKKTAPIRCTAWIEMEDVGGSTEVLQPRLMWKPMGEPHLRRKQIKMHSLYEINFLDVCRILPAEYVNRSLHPLVKSSTSLAIQTMSQGTIMFEMPSVRDRDLNMRGLKLMVARQASTSIFTTGTNDVSTEFDRTNNGVHNELETMWVGTIDEEGHDSVDLSCIGIETVLSPSGIPSLQDAAKAM